MSIKVCNSLDEIVKFILYKHKTLSGQGGGAISYKLLKKPDGRRIPIEESHGFKIIKFNVLGENSLSITQLSSGFAMKGQYKCKMSSQLFLHDLVLVNVYDHRSEFFSGSSIDFSYITKDPGVPIQMLQEWLYEDPGIIRAQWSYDDRMVNQILDEISVGRKIMKDDRMNRSLDFEKLENLDDGD